MKLPSGTVIVNSIYKNRTGTHRYDTRTSGLRARHISSLRPHASTSSPGRSRGRFVQTRPAMRPAKSRCQAQAQPSINQTAGNPLATTLLTAAAYHIMRGAMLASKAPNQTPAGLNLRAGAAS